jgi:ATP-dependent DNA helicase RecG
MELTADLVARVRAWVAGGERFNVEFKSDLRGPMNDRDLVEAVVCLANAGQPNPAASRR